MTDSIQMGVFKGFSPLHSFLPGLWFLVLCTFPFPSFLVLRFILTNWTLISDCLSGYVLCHSSKQYVLLSVLLCLLASGLVVFFLFPHSVLVDDDGIKVVKVTFNKQDSLVILAITVRWRALLPR